MRNMEIADMAGDRDNKKHLAVHGFDLLCSVWHSVRFLLVSEIPLELRPRTHQAHIAFNALKNQGGQSS